MMIQELTISAVAQQAGIRASAIRYYEGIGLLPPPRRINGRRRYDSSVLDLLGVIKFAQQAGFTIEEVRTLFHGFEAQVPASKRWRTLCVEKLPEVEALILRAMAMKRLLEQALECDCLTLEDCAQLCR
jgi:MerR family redox-sensitive transcriptional activator SoxR